MAWREIVNRRQKNSKTYQDSQASRRFYLNATLTSIHYEGNLDSGVFDTELDLTPVRVDNPQFDGWRITQCGWHYALGKDLAGHGEQDGWVGFGGRKGQNWFKFRLQRVVYLHWPTREWNDLGGIPNYNRANLSQETGVSTIGPSNDEINVSSKATWSNIWNTPGGGKLDVNWRSDGVCLKEEIIINRAGREWIEANKPPTTPLNETYFGFVFQLDWSDIPKVIRDGILQDVDGDFADDGDSIELRDALDRLLGLLPISDVTVGRGKGRSKAPLRKRFWSQDGKHYLLVGVRCDVLAGLPAGDLIFDPTVTPRVGASHDDTTAWPPDQIDNFGNVYIGELGGANFNGFRFTLNVPAGATISAAKLTFRAANPGTLGVLSNINYQDANDPGDFNGDSFATFMARTRSAAQQAWDFSTAWTSGNDYDSVDFAAVIQALVDEAYWAANEHCVIFVDDDGSPNGVFREAVSYDTSAANAPLLTVVYTVTAGDIKQLAGVAWASVKQHGTIAEASLKQVATIDAN